MEQVSQLVESIIEGIEEKKGRDIVVANLENIESAICRYFVICQGSSPAQVEAIMESISEKVRLNRGEKPVRIAGIENAQWVAMDYIDVLVHIFLPDIRAYYDLEHLWDDATITRLVNKE